MTMSAAVTVGFSDMTGTLPEPARNENGPGREHPGPFLDEEGGEVPHQPREVVS